METNHNTRLTASEISNLWTQYMFDSMNLCFFNYALEHLEDDDIRSVYDKASTLSEQHLVESGRFLEQEKFPIPKGFTEEDVKKQADRLFQDPFYLNYLYIMSLHGLTAYGLSVGNSIREDLRNYFIKCNQEALNLYNEVIAAMLTKGIYTRPPVLNPSGKVSFVQDQGFLAGWFGDRRPLTALEIGNITFNMNKMNLHIALKVGFGQVASSKEVRQICERGIRITSKHTEIFRGIFREEKLNSPMSWQSHVTNTTESIFSDKYIMYQLHLSTQAAIAFYGAALSVSARRDLGTQYTRLISELLKFSEDCANIMIKNGWFEEPPMNVDRDKLMKEK
ncbi:DUF3231 family protein [Salinibacillus xinjiangensis]|uniref:DUF3231 family protein n=1 Tax=Salinibacillus xinjiangensis TaxID=1229268 RepID=A0A6G1X432_9BACI|nr:DUF3231 family protein [Salinibacillus xinjiangensis]MRG85679.1 DUF3231 family protein [Salinibacillus xinjiangensis]